MIETAVISCIKLWIAVQKQMYTANIGPFQNPLQHELITYFPTMESVGSDFQWGVIRYWAKVKHRHKAKTSMGCFKYDYGFWSLLYHLHNPSVFCGMLVYCWGVLWIEGI